MSDPEIEIRFTPEFKRPLRALSRRYRHIRSDLHPLLVELGSGSLVGDAIQGTDYRVYKVRLRNSDIEKGKSSGYRVIYEARSPTLLILITLYSKLDQGDISAEEIRRILAEHAR